MLKCIIQFLLVASNLHAGEQLLFQKEFPYNSDIKVSPHFDYIVESRQHELYTGFKSTGISVYDSSGMKLWENCDVVFENLSWDAHVIVGRIFNKNDVKKYWETVYKETPETYWEDETDWTQKLDGPCLVLDMVSGVIVKQFKNYKEYLKYKDALFLVREGEKAMRHWLKIIPKGYTFEGVSKSGKYAMATNTAYQSPSEGESKCYERVGEDGLGWKYRGQCSTLYFLLATDWLYHFSDSNGVITVDLYDSDLKRATIFSERVLNDEQTKGIASHRGSRSVYASGGKLILNAGGIIFRVIGISGRTIKDLHLYKNREERLKYCRAQMHGIDYVPLYLHADNSYFKVYAWDEIEQHWAEQKDNSVKGLYKTGKRIMKVYKGNLLEKE